MIEVHDVTKTFRRPATVAGLLRGRMRGAPFTALEGVSFELPRGEGLGLMGPNGAGKSTILRVLAGLLVPTRGTARVAGIDTREGGARLARKVGYVAADERGLESRISPREHLAWYAALYGLARADALRRVDELLESVGLSAAAHRPLRELSTGMRRRVLLARALLAKPEVLLLDEPTRGVDPAGAEAFHERLRASMAAGSTLVIATHDRQEAMATCSRVAVLAGGRLEVLASPAAATKRVAEMAIA